jgi:predicted acylesterase/phospholipase RssA
VEPSPALSAGNGHRADLDAGRKPTDPIRILSLDGGGMRGVMAARVLVELERLSGRPIAGLFDIIAGTSTGGMIALGVTKPGGDGKPALTAQEVFDTYLSYGRRIFPRVVWRPIQLERLRASRPIVVQRVGALARPARYGNARYLAVGLRAVLDEMLGTTRLAEAMADVIVPSYDWKAGRAVVFRSRGARHGDLINPTMAQVARATTAAPTYFPAFRLRVPDRELVLIDGGVVANNPTSVAYYEALYHAHFQGRIDPDFLVVSLGTGRPPEEIPTYQQLWSRNWLRMGMGMLGVMFDGTSEIVDELITEVIRPKHPGSRYWRLNTDLRGVRLNMDDASPGQLEKLVGLAERMMAERKDDLTQMVRLLTATAAAPADGHSPGTPAAEPGSGRRSGRARRPRSKD